MSSLDQAMTPEVYFHSCGFALQAWLKVWASPLSTSTPARKFLYGQYRLIFAELKQN
ncbi:hypothetical protein [Acinetobacter baumannii]|uniref:hypothetical protein n=1 Tax=Acinetobacter baumannii TaxID=470 RepID=UPI002949DA62|nr:hypothetical protein [Acinetobacter baumannii]MDV5263237.1 hypothetical protein [Acinetobacter baumannii]